jgi:hypothetical protein
MVGQYGVEPPESTRHIAGLYMWAIIVSGKSIIEDQDKFLQRRIGPKEQMFDGGHTLGCPLHLVAGKGPSTKFERSSEAKKIRPNTEAVNYRSRYEISKWLSGKHLNLRGHLINV